MKTDTDHSQPAEVDDDIDVHVDDSAALIRHDYRLDAPADKVWRAISIPALRQQWLPGLDLASPDPLHSIPGKEIRYAMRDQAPPFTGSEVTLRLTPMHDNGTLLSIIHVARADRAAVAANDSAPFMCAA